MAYSPYNLKVGDTGVRGQVYSCSYQVPFDAFLVGVAAISGTVAYTPGDCAGRSVGIAYAAAAQAFPQFSFVTFDVIGTYDAGSGDGSGILISNIQPA